MLSDELAARQRCLDDSMRGVRRCRDTAISRTRSCVKDTARPLIYAENLDMVLTMKPGTDDILMNNHAGACPDWQRASATKRHCQLSS